MRLGPSRKLKLAEIVGSIRYHSFSILTKDTYKMPALLIFIIGTLMIIFWDVIKENVEVIGTLATSLAFFATAWAAYEARHSAKAAMRATQLTSASLLEMKKASFKEWYGILLEQHNKLLEDVNKALINDSQFDVKLGINTIKGIYYHVTKNPIYTKYINHVTLILHYIDKDFYLPSTAVNERKSYIQQLRNNINPRVSLIIAIFGLDIDNNKTYDAKKLFILLNDFDFFDNELFFEDAVSQVNFLDNYVAVLFNKEYRNAVEFYVEAMLLGCEPPDITASNRHQRITFAVLWNYNNPCRQYLLQSFNDLPLHIRNSIGFKMEKSADEVAKFDSWIPGFVGWKLNIPGFKERVIKDKKEITRLIKIYYKYPFEQMQTGIILTNGATNIFGQDIEKNLSRYALDRAYLELNTNPRQDEVIDGIVEEVESMVDVYKKKLNALSFNK
ncbi:hypothetical protein [Cronobacter sakazakii]|uniref:hypothetical protein n=2 Tax=Cronobacter TaxID=413496 RepID=UPI0029C9CFC4|nr:hypothetical protein [Cronobacter sakazakii]ELY2747182.1 hypothetical protein [Cronobacter sakazakii]ELY4588729.1 hypothetical protein [Cronobacter sakazakii]